MPKPISMLEPGRPTEPQSGMDNCRWEKITGWKLAGFAAGTAAFFGLLLACERGFVFGLDHANLLFQEAGHPSIGIFSTRL